MILFKLIVVFMYTAASYYKLAADQGDKESQYCLGYAYSTGKGVEEDMEEGE